MSIILKYGYELQYIKEAMYQELGKRFRLEIRQKQKQRYFSKVRHDFHKSKCQLQHVLTHIQRLQTNKLTQQFIYDNMEEIIGVVKNAKQLTVTKNGLEPIIDFFICLNEIIQDRGKSIMKNSMSIWDEEEELKLVGEGLRAFEGLTKQIAIFMINLLAEKDEVIVGYLDQAAQLTKYRCFIGLFENIFINEQKSREQKYMFLDQYLGHIENYSRYFLTNCSLMIKVLFQAVIREPFGLDFQYHARIINIVNRTLGIIQFNTQLKEVDKNDFFQYSLEIVKEICSSCELASSMTMNSPNIIKLVEQGIGLNLSDEAVEKALMLLSILTSYDFFVIKMHQQQHILIIYLERNFQWIGNHKLIHANHIQGVLYVFSNLVTCPEACFRFLQRQFNFDNQTHSSIQFLSIIFNMYYKNIRIQNECFYLISNILACLVNNIEHTAKLTYDFLNDAESIILESVFSKEPEPIQGILNCILRLMSEQYHHPFFTNTSFLVRIEEVVQSEERRGGLRPIALEILELSQQ